MRFPKSDWSIVIPLPTMDLQITIRMVILLSNIDFSVNEIHNSHLHKPVGAQTLRHT